MCNINESRNYKYKNLHHGYDLFFIEFRMRHAKSVLSVHVFSTASYSPCQSQRYHHHEIRIIESQTSTKRGRKRRLSRFAEKRFIAYQARYGCCGDLL